MYIVYNETLFSDYLKRAPIYRLIAFKIGEKKLLVIQFDSLYFLILYVKIRNSNKRFSYIHSMISEQRHLLIIIML